MPTTLTLRRYFAAALCGAACSGATAQANFKPQGKTHLGAHPSSKRQGRMSLETTQARRSQYRDAAPDLREGLTFGYRCPRSRAVPDGRLAVTTRSPPAPLP
jgi:hypothetical protein